MAVFDGYDRLEETSKTNFYILFNLEASKL